MNGGLGIIKLNLQNKAMGVKLVWKMYQDLNNKWAKVLYHKYLNPLDTLNIFKTINPHKGSKAWNFILDYREILS